MTNIVVPMAGAGSRFTEAGFKTPKPFINVAGKPMIERVLANLAVPGARFILIAREEHMPEYQSVLKGITDDYQAEVLTIDFLTAGQASTVFLAARLINTDQPLLIANSDQLVDIEVADYLADSDDRGLDGSILTFATDDPKWSFAAVDVEGIVTETKEKVPISNHATVGMYYFREGRDFVSSAAEMMAHNDRTNDEFYACPAYNYGISAGKRYGIYEIAEDQMHGLGTPEDLKVYLEHAKVEV